MKLRTVRLLDIRGNDDTIHDAMAAHALLQAMDEADDRDEFVFTSNTTGWIKQRAAEILASWGVAQEVAG